MQREAITLAYYGGYTHTEVATMLDLPVGTASPDQRRNDPVARRTGSGGAMSADIHALSGAYAVDARRTSSEPAFERHLEACPTCAQEVRELEATTARLGAAAASPPPPELWDRIRAAGPGYPPVPPVVGRASGAGGWGAAAPPPPGRRVPPLLAAAAALLVAVPRRPRQPGARLGRADRVEPHC